MSLLSFSSVYLFETIVHSEKFDAKFNGAANTLGKHTFETSSLRHTQSHDSFSEMNDKLFNGHKWLLSF